MNDLYAAVVTGTLSLVGLGWWGHDAWTVRHADRDLLAVAASVGVLRARRDDDLHAEFTDGLTDHINGRTP